MELKKMLASQTGISDKYVSERHAIACQSKLTAGQAAKILKNKGCDISAKSIVEAFELLFNSKPEWHHSGFFKGKTGSKMGKTYFFTNEQIQEMMNRFSEIQNLFNVKERHIIHLKETIVKGIYWQWDYDYSGKHGKKQCFKVLKIYNGPKFTKPPNFVALSEIQFVKAVSLENKKYFGWDVPEISEFN